MTIHVLHPGLFTTLQDLGRPGWQRFGVSVGGAMQPSAVRVANWLVGNDEAEAALEITLGGPSLRFDDDAFVAICGAELSPTIAGQPLTRNRAIWVRRGSVLKFGAATRGCRAYLAVAGGFDVPIILGGRGTYLSAGIGGWKGRTLRKGDALPVQPRSAVAESRFAQLAERAAQRPVLASHRFVAFDEGLCQSFPAAVRVVQGGQFAWFTAQSRQRLFEETYEITPQSDRMGYRLAGPSLELESPRELLSEAVAAGTVQVPPSGQPMILLADRPTTGGYPKIAHVATVDLALLAQLKPGDTMRFQEISLSDAQQLHRTRAALLAKMKMGLELT